MCQYKILVVDDNKDIQELLKIFLDEQGYRVVLAANGLEGLQCFQQETFDIVVTEIRMPGINGNILGKTLKDLQPTIPIIACTSSSDIATRYFDEIIDKPFRLNTLLSSIQSLTVVHENRTSKSLRQLKGIFSWNRAK